MTIVRSSQPSVDERHRALGSGLQTIHLTKDFEVGRGRWRRARGKLRAVDGVWLEIPPGTSLGLVGESGSGKSTTGLLLAGLIMPSDGRILYGGQDLQSMSRQERKAYHRRVQLVFQDPYSSLNPRLSVGEAVAEPLRIQRVPASQARDAVPDLLAAVGLSGDLAYRYPRELSGGQRQRVSIARALSLTPEVLVLDEPVSALDVSIQAQVLGLLQDLQERLQLSYVFISHDLAAVGQICDQIAVMYLGRIVESGSLAQIVESPAHPYTKALLSAVPTGDRRGRRRIILDGDVPDPTSPPSGCHFRSRCWKARDLCAREAPGLASRPPVSQACACHYPETT